MKILDISLDSGNAGVLLMNLVVTISATDVDGIIDGVAYMIGDKTTAFVGFDSDGSSLFTTACVYGGPGDMLDDCGAPIWNHWW